MSVYVDDLRVCIKNKNWPYTQVCHLVADSESELLNFGDRMGLKRAWFQRKTMLHYDLTVRMRAKAIGLGAIQIAPKAFVMLLKAQRIKNG